MAVRMLKSLKQDYLAEYILHHLNVLERIQSGKPYILCTYYVPSEILNLFEVEYIYIERIVGIAVSSGIVRKPMDFGLPETICSYQKAFLTLLEHKSIPLPEFILAFDYPCQDALYLCEFIHRSYKIPMKKITHQLMQQGFRQVYEQLLQMYPIRQSIEQVVKLSNLASECKMQIDSCRQEYPGILPSDQCLKLFTVENDFGNDAALVVLNKLKDTMEEKQKGFLRTDKQKIFWMGLVPLYDNSILSRMEKKFDVTVIYEEMWMFGETAITAEHFFADLEKKVKSGLFYELEDRMQRIGLIVKEMKADMIINFSQRHCSFLPPQIKKMKDYFDREHIRMYNVGGDVIEGRDQMEKLALILKKHRNREFMDD